MAERGTGGASGALALAADPGRFLATVQIGITLVGILSGAFSGATLGERLSGFLMGLGVPANWSFVVGIGTVVTVITYLSLIIGELVPKQLALKNAERIACMVAPAMIVLAKVAAPVVWVLDKSGKAVLAVMGSKPEDRQRVTEEEIRAIIAEGETAGVLEPGEHRMIARVMRLGDRPVRSVMTPRHEVDMIDLTDPFEEVMAVIAGSPHSYFPAHEGNADEVVGIITAKDLFASSVSGAIVDLKGLVRQAPIVPDSLDALDVVGALRRGAVHMGLVHDEYGSFEGVVTSTDILEAIVGSFVDEQDGEQPIVAREDGSLLLAGWMRVDDMAEALEIVLPQNRHYETVAGFLIEAFARLPDVGDHIRVQQWRFEVVDLDGLRIDKVLATKA